MAVTVAGKNRPMIFGLKTPPRRFRTLTAKGPLSGDALQTPISGLPEIGA
jgi:hypothetical protein